MHNPQEKASHAIKASLHSNHEGEEEESLEYDNIYLVTEKKQKHADTQTAHIADTGYRRADLGSDVMSINLEVYP